MLLTQSQPEVRLDALWAERPLIGRGRDRSSIWQKERSTPTRGCGRAPVGRLLPSSASHKTRANRKVAYILPLGCWWVHSGETHHIMTIKTEAGKPELTYSKSRGLVALVSGTDHHDWMFLILYNRFRPLCSLLNDLNIHPFPFLCCSFYETAEDGAERLHSEAGHKLLRLQAVSTIWLMLLFHNKWKIGKPTTSVSYSSVQWGNFVT